MAFLRLLEGVRIPLLDTFFSLITYFGEETLFLVVGLILFWCVNKYLGRYLIAVGLGGTVLNQWLKIVCRIPRPWVLDESFTIVESARAGATGYSFPSGHTQIAVGVYGGIARWTKKTWLRVLGIVLAVVVPFSRMYLGVHTPLDVGVAAATSIILLLILYPPMREGEGCVRGERIVFAILSVFSVAFVIFMHAAHFPEDIDQANLEHAFSSGWTLMGAMLGMWLSMELDEKYIHFDTKATLAGQAIKLLGGLIVVLALRMGLKPLLHAVIPSVLLADGIRYFLMVLVAGAVWPLTFRKLAVIGKK